MNRRERRKQNNQLKSADEIPYNRPITNNNPKPKGKTLYELASERHPSLTQPITTTNNNNDISSEEKEIETPYLDTIFLASSLSVIHFTLEVLTVHQYAQELKFIPIIQHTLFRTFPILLFLIHLFHGHLLPDGIFSKKIISSNWIFISKQLIYLFFANLSGCYLISITNDKGYFAIMKNSPSIGTLWLWFIIELNLFGSILGVLGPAFYAWWFGYGIF